MNESRNTPNSSPSSSSTTTATQRYKLIFYVPISSLAAGAGRHPKYTECCFTTLGMGQFRPGDAAKPNIGTVGELEEVQEARVETSIVGEEVVRRVVRELRSVHPYEAPEIEVIKLEDF